MMRPLALAAFLALLAAPVAAQSIGEPLPGRRDALSAPSRKPVATTQNARPCPEYGAGFVRLEGSQTCVRLRGAVRAEFGRSSQRSYDGSRYGSSAGGVVQLETNSETTLGPVRSVVRLRGQVDRGLETGPYRN